MDKIPKRNPLEIERSATVMSIIYGLEKIYREDAIYQYIVEQAAKLVQAEGGILFQLDTKTSTLKPMASLGIYLEDILDITFKFGVCTCGWVAQSLEPIISNDFTHDKRFKSSYDKQTGYTTKSVLCTILPIYQGKMFVLELTNQKNNKFEEDHIKMITVLGKYMAIALEKSEILQIRDQMSYFGKSVLNCMPIGLISFDIYGKVTGFSNRAMEILMLDGWKKVIGQSIETLLSDRLEFKEIVTELMDKKKIVNAREMDFLRPTGKIHIEYSTFVIEHPTEEEILGYGLLFHDISKFKANY